MSACPKCGREYPAGSGDQCYNSLRDDREHSGFRRRRPKPSSEGVPTGGATPDPLTKSLTPEEIRDISKPKGADPEKIGLPTKRKYRGLTVLRGPAAQRAIGGSQGSSAMKSFQPSGTGDLTIRRKGVNEFLEALFTKPVLLSEILDDASYSPQRVKRLKERADSFLPYLVDRWAEICHRALGKSSKLVIRHFGLDGLPPKPGGKVGGSVESIQGMMFVLRGRTTKFREAVLASARKFL